ncbi:branched-chain amino acid ABC transporter permease, partial [Mesorhizobium sp. M7A.T.Ca.TU.009.01.3.2]
RESGEFRTLGLGLIIALSVVLMPKGLVGRFGDVIDWLGRRRASPDSKPAASSIVQSPTPAGK